MSTSTKAFYNDKVVTQFAVVTVLVREFRNGVQIGSYTRDLQFAIIACNNTLQPAVMCSGLASSISLWLMPPTQGTKTIEVGATCAR